MSLRERKKQASRDAILAAADELFTKDGFSNTRTRDIATAANVSYQTLYNYFPSKGKLAEAVVARDIASVSAELEPLLDETEGDLLGTLSAINRIRLTAITRRERALWREVVIGRLEEDVQAIEIYQRIDHFARTGLTRLLSQAQGTGTLAPDLPLHIAVDVLFAISQNISADYLINPELTLRDLQTRIDQQTAAFLQPYLTA